MVSRRPPKLSYSQLLSEIESGNIESLMLIPARREVIAKYSDGTEIIVPILRNDQNILRTAQLSKIPLTVKDIRQEQALAGLFGNLGFILILIVGLSFLFKRSAGIANKAMGFAKSQARLKAQEQLQVRFEDVAGVSDASEELKEVVSFLKNPDLLIKLGAKIPKGILLIGPPGTGKTLLAKAIAGEAEVPFFSIAASEFVELFVGVGASRVRDLFQQAKDKAPCIIFIDEIDAVGRQRGAGIGGGNDEREQTLNQLLTEMDGFGDNSGIILLAATNRPDVLDSALMRPGRFDRRIEVLLPDRIGRRDILAVHARSKPLDQNVSMDDWAIRTPGFSGADLQNLLNEAAIITARDNLNIIGNNQIEAALEKITVGLRVSSLQDGPSKRLVAYHEVGHALVASQLKTADQVDKITILPRGSGIGGFTRFFPNEDVIDSGLYSKNYLSNKIIVALGGRAAEQIVFGDAEITQGASSDLELVASLAREMVTKFGFSKLGPISHNSSDSAVFLGRDLIERKGSYSDSTGNAIDIEIREIAKSSLKRAVEILKDKRELMDNIVEILLVEETIDSTKFKELLKSQLYA